MIYIYVENSLGETYMSRQRLTNGMWQIPPQECHISSSKAQFKSVQGAGAEDVWMSILSVRDTSVLSFAAGAKRDANSSLSFGTTVPKRE